MGTKLYLDAQITREALDAALKREHRVVAELIRVLLHLIGQPNLHPIRKVVNLPTITRKTMRGSLGWPAHDAQERPWNTRPAFPNVCSAGTSTDQPEFLRFLVSSAGILRAKIDISTQWIIKLYVCFIVRYAQMEALV